MQLECNSNAANNCNTLNVVTIAAFVCNVFSFVKLDYFESHLTSAKTIQNEENRENDLVANRWGFSLGGNGWGISFGSDKPQEMSAM